MSRINRRGFLASSVGAFASGRLLGQLPIANDDKVKISDEAPFRPNTLFLTWQADPTTTMTVQWVGTRGETDDPTVYYAPVGGDLWLPQPTLAKPFGETDFKVFRASITDLKPGTDYEFVIGTASPIYRFRTMPAKATDTIQFVSGGDCGVNPHTVANNIEAAKQDPAFAVIGGDLGYDNGRSAAICFAFLRNYSKHMIGRHGRLIPMLACIGNHEVDGGYAMKRDKAPYFYALFDGLFPDTGYNCLDFGDYLSLVLLDTGHTSAIAGAQADWLNKSLTARAEHPHVICANHVPAYPSFRRYEGVNGKAGTGEENRHHWVPLFEKHRVPVVLEHHDHTFKRSKPLLNGLAHDNGVLYLGDGSWGRLRSPQSPEKLHYLAASSRDYHLSVHRLEGDDRFHVALDEFGRVTDVCHSRQRKRGLVTAGG